MINALEKLVEIGTGARKRNYFSDLQLSWSLSCPSTWRARDLTALKRTRMQTERREEGGGRRHQPWGHKGLLCGNNQWFAAAKSQCLWSWYLQESSVSMRARDQFSLCAKGRRCSLPSAVSSPQHWTVDCSNKSNKRWWKYTLNKVDA